MQEKDLHRINELTLKYATKTITPEEQAELDLWLNANPINKERFESRINEDNVWTALSHLREGDRLRDSARFKLDYLSKDQPFILPRKTYRWRWYAASAAVFLFLFAGLLFVFHRKEKTSPQAAYSKPVDILPGGNKAILQLADGNRIDLSKAGDGTLAHQGNTQIVKLGGGQLSYQGTATKSTTVGYNTIFTPSGGQYKVTLPDGSVVWLNAESSLRFPTNFTGSQRIVEMTGEVYFEVAKNKAMPFHVMVGYMNVRILGTHFNINAYPNEKTKQMTLLEGSIAIQAVGSSVILRPGEQASVDDHIRVAKVDTDEAIAWKDGYFLFNGADIETVMRQIGRWYNVRVSFEGQKTNKKLSARVSRQKNASDVLEILQASGYHFLISDDGKTISILP